MSDFSEKMKEYESKKKKSNRGIITIIIVGLLVFAALFLYNIQVKNQKRLDTKLLIESNNEQIKQIEKKDSILYTKNVQKEDSIKIALKQVQVEIEKIKQAAGNNTYVLSKIDSLQTKVDNIIVIAADTITVRYYKRKADKGKIEGVVKSIASPNYNLEYREVSNDDGKNTVNSLYYGKNVKKEYVDILYKKLLKSGVKIKYLKPFLSARGFEWKDSAIEIGFEKPTSTTDENARLFVRVYSYKPKGKNRYLIRDKLEAKGFQTKLFPDWREKPSFFSDESTVLYYDKSQKEKALSIAETLAGLTRTPFKTRIGAGYGVTREERKTVFIVHYNGNGG